MGSKAALLACAIAALAAAACEGEATDLAPQESYETMGGVLGETGIDSKATGLTALTYFESTVFPSLASTCGSCHADAGPGPAWIFGDASKTYVTMENLGLLAKDSALLSKGAHSTGAPALTADQTTMVNTWITKEYATRGGAAPTSIKNALGSCFDQAKFDAIGLQALRTTKRANENANTCTGCNNSPCMTCHTTDTATGVIIAYGNANVPATFTFDKAKDVPFMDLYIGTNGTQIVGSKKLSLKSRSTAADKPYTHPMYTITTLMQEAIDAFAADVNAKYQAGGCR